jgi:hypothetical protein|tara:strand:+ start:413 stop:847 length:435 start_codon:yes stop_codon:yes gene_type:complete
LSFNESKILISYITLALLALNGCAGRTPQPVIISKSDDKAKSCKEIDTELSIIKSDIQKRYPKIKDTDRNNLGVSLLGSLFPPIIPLSVFSDIRKADSVELNALQRRHNHLVAVERKNGCGFEHSIIPVTEVNSVLRKIEGILP